MPETLVVNEIYLSLQGESTLAGLPCIFVRLTACNLRCSYCDTAYAFTEGKKQSLEDILAEIKRQAAPYLPTSIQAGDQKVLKFDHAHGPWKHPLIRLPGTFSPSGGEGRDEGEALENSTGIQNSERPVRLPLVELTGGEPLLQPNALPLMRALCDEGFTVLLETSGAHDVSKVDLRVRRIMDLKCPSSGEVERNRWKNLKHLKELDEIKFVVGTEQDYEWSKAQIEEHKLAAICPLLMSWVQPLTPEQQDKSLKKVPAGQTPISRRALAERIIADALPVRFQAQLHKIIWPPDERGV